MYREIWNAKVSNFFSVLLQIMNIVPPANKYKDRMWMGGG